MANQTHRSTKQYQVTAYYYSANTDENDVCMVEGQEEVHAFSYLDAIARSLVYLFDGPVEYNHLDGRFKTEVATPVGTFIFSIDKTPCQFLRNDVLRIQGSPKWTWFIHHISVLGTIFTDKDDAKEYIKYLIENNMQIPGTEYIEENFKNFEKMKNKDFEIEIAKRKELINKGLLKAEDLYSPLPLKQNIQLGL